MRKAKERTYNGPEHKLENGYIIKPGESHTIHVWCILTGKNKNTMTSSVIKKGIEHALTTPVLKRKGTEGLSAAKKFAIRKFGEKIKCNWLGGKASLDRCYKCQEKTDTGEFCMAHKWIMCK